MSAEGLDRNERGPFEPAGMVECVECPACGFTFAAIHTDDNPDVPPSLQGYTCECGYSADRSPS